MGLSSSVLFQETKYPDPNTVGKSVVANDAGAPSPSVEIQGARATMS